MQTHERERLQEISDQRGDALVARQAIVELRECGEVFYEACQSMLKTTGGSEHWHGETHESLVLIERAVSLYKATMGIV